VSNHILLHHVTLSRLQWLGDERGVPLQMEQRDGYLLCYQRKGLHASDHRVDGRPAGKISLDPGQFLLFDLRRRHNSVIQGAIESFSIFVPHVSLKTLHYENEVLPFSTLRIMERSGCVDPIIRHIMECLIPAFGKRAAGSRLFQDHLTLALMTHLMCHYGEGEVRPKSSIGGLAPWRERRSKELLLAHPRGDVSLETLAGECGLSRAHFARSFKASTGTSPMSWLLSQRLQRAKTLLVDSNFTLTEIADLTGFADQSHFSRVFSRHVRIAPSEWRRRRRY
jgi:AraC family transcriptional regulator